jgi:hypothetical protein
VRRALLIIGIVCGIGLAFGSGWFWGGFTQARREAERRYQQDCEMFAPVLTADPAFRRLLTFDFPVNGYSLGGPVATPADYDRLRREVARAFGEPRVGHILADVWVEALAEPAAAVDRPKAAGR